MTEISDLPGRQLLLPSVFILFNKTDAFIILKEKKEEKVARSEDVSFCMFLNEQ